MTEDDAFLDANESAQRKFRGGGLRGLSQPVTVCHLCCAKCHKSLVKHRDYRFPSTMQHTHIGAPCAINLSSFISHLFRRHGNVQRCRVTLKREALLCAHMLRGGAFCIFSRSAGGFVALSLRDRHPRSDPFPSLSCGVTKRDDPEETYRSRRGSDEEAPSAKLGIGSLTRR